MSAWKMEVEVVIDDELLNAHDGDEAPPPNDPREWFGGDLVKAIEEGFAEVVHDELTVEPVAG